MNKKKAKRQNIIELILLLTLVILLNVVGAFLFHRFDLTQEKRYTLAKSTKQVLQKLDDIIYIKVYLEGDDLPAKFRRMKHATKELLDEFRVYGKNNIEYEFVNPNESPDEKTRVEIYNQLIADGLNYYNVQSKERSGTSTKQVIFPGAMITYSAHGQELERPVNLFKEDVSAQLYDETVNRSIENMEYEFISAIQVITKENTAKIAMIEGHDELDQYQTASLVKGLTNFYTVERVKIGGQIASLSGYKAVIVAGPTSAFSDPDKFILDQFIMKGGKALWLVDAVNVDLNEIATKTETMGEINQIRLGDMLFYYGARINSDLIQDYVCLGMPVDVSPPDSEQPQWQMAPMVYFPVVAARADNPVTRNLNPIRYEFVSSIDTVGEDPRIKKTVLLTSSANSRIVRAPFRISTEIFAERPEPSKFPLSDLPVAVLLEGEFTSFYKNKLPPALLENELFKVYEQSTAPTRMIVISDGQVARNYVDRSGEQVRYSPLGYDRYNPNFAFGNLDFLLNCVNYLMDDEGMMGIRTREVRLRLLNYARLSEERIKWQMINLILPVMLVLLAGGVYFFIRKRKYAR